MIKSFRDLIAWQKSMDLGTAFYALARILPKDEIFGLSSQMRRAAVSIPSNIAEGQARNSPKEFINFVSIAKGSHAELSTQLDLCARLSCFSPADLAPVSALADEVGRMLTVISSRLRAKLAPSPLPPNP